MADRPSCYRQRVTVDDNVIWLSISAFARVYSRDTRTIRRWCTDGYVLTLGYRLRRECRGQWRIGVPSDEYRTFRTAPLAIPALPC
jgi:hypothetical protein